MNHTSARTISLASFVRLVSMAKVTTHATFSPTVHYDEHDQGHSEGVICNQIDMDGAWLTSVYGYTYPIGDPKSVVLTESPIRWVQDGLKLIVLDDDETEITPDRLGQIACMNNSEASKVDISVFWQKKAPRKIRQGKPLI